MKIVITTFTYYPNLDGVSEATRFLAESLVEIGHQVIVFTSVTEVLPKEFVHNGVNIRQYRMVNSHILKLIGSREEMDRFSVDLLGERPDLLICECWDAWPTVLGLPVLKKLSCPKILVSHGFSSHLKPRSAPPPFFGFGQWWHGVIWTANYIPKLIKAFDRFIFLAHRKDTKRFIDHSVMSFIDSDIVRIIPNSPNLEPFSDFPNDFREHYGISAGPMILCVANFSERKNQELAVNSFFETGIPESTLVCIGSEKNDYFDKVSALVRKKESSHPDQKVLLLTGMTRVDMMKAYAACDMTLLTAHQETQPIVLIESMSFSKPWLATSSGCIPEMEGGVVVSSQHELVRRLKELMTNPGLIARLGAEGRSAFERRYQQTAVKAQWEMLIKEVSSNAPSL
jgi:glycosyltransferase involved in cell wall biosynthesis